MAIGDNENSDDDNLTDISGVSELNLEEEESEDEIEFDIGNMLWSDEMPEDVIYDHPQFTGAPRGPIQPVRTFLECIQLYLTSDVMNLIVIETNRVLQLRGPKRNRQGQQVNRNLLTVNELWVYIAVAMLGEIHNKNVSRDNWSTDDLLFTPIFGKVMSRDRYEEIGKYLHFVDNTVRPPAGDKFWKIRNLFDLFNESFQREFSLDRTVSVDESLMLWRGHHSLRRYIPSKADKWGIKFYVLAESRSGYVWRILVDEGKNTRITINAQFPKLQKPGQYVMELMLPLLGLGHFIVMDNFYTDLQLFDYLLRNSTSCLGTIRKGRRLLPKEVTKCSFKKKDKGEMVIKYSTNVYAFCWMDNREVRMLSSVGSPDKDMNGKPSVIRAYNEGMPGVDLADQKRHGRITGRKRLKRWYKRVFYHLLDISLVNACIVANCIPGVVIEQREFRMDLIKQILRKYSAVVPGINEIGVEHKLTKLKQGRCLFPECKSKPNTFCEGCNRYICSVPCFSKAHTILKNE